MGEITLRTATPDDAKQLLDIYSYYVDKTAITFEYDVPSLNEFQGRITETLRKYPYIIAEKDERIIGYAYAGVFKDRAAYSHCAEVTVYVHKDSHRHGLGKLLYSELESLLRQMGISNLYACIGIPSDTDDEYLDHNSMDFHMHIGYKLAGKFAKCGYKFGRWYDMVWLEKMIGDHRDDTRDIIPFPQLNNN